MPLLLFHLFQTHVFLGNYPIWQFVNVTARNVLGPCNRLPTRFGRLDALPLLGIVLVVMLARWGLDWLPRIYERLPL